MIKLIIDSTTDLPQDLIEKYKMDVVPLVVSIDDIEYKDKVSISVDELYNELRNGANPKTSLPHPEDVYIALEKALETNNDVIFITISSKLSGTYQSIKLVSEEMKEKYPTRKIEIIDSLGGSGIPALMALQCGKMIEHNHSFEEIVDVLHDLSENNEHIFTIDNLKNLIKSGRINKKEALVGNILRIKPILYVEHGEIKLLKKVHGKNKAIHTIIDLVTDRIKAFPNQIIAVNHADDYDLAVLIKQMLIEKLGNLEVVIEKIGSALGTHLGIGGIGVFFFTKKPKYYYL